MPQLGETVAEGTVSRWYKAVGDPVAAGEALFEIETDKTSMEVEATAAGVLATIHVGEGETVAVGTAVAVLDPKGAQPAPSAAKAAAATNGSGVAPRAGFGPFSEVATPSGNYGPAKGPHGLRITPLARRLIAQNAVDLGALAARITSDGGDRIAKADVMNFIATAPHNAPPTPAPQRARIERPTPRSIPAPDTPYDVVPLNRIRRTTAAHLVDAWTSIPHVVQAVEVDFQRVEHARRAYNGAESARSGVKLSFLPFIARAVVLAIKDYPLVNARLDNDRLLVHRRVNLGIAVDLSHEGLVVPVIRGAEDLMVVGLARAIAERIERARSNALSEDDFAGATYTLSNSGSFGTLFTAPIVNPPQVAILSTDGIAKKPVVIESEGGDAIAIRPVGVLAQSFDHRAFDGAYSAAFLKRLKGLIEETDWDLLLG